MHACQHWPFYMRGNVFRMFLKLFSPLENFMYVYFAQLYIYL